MARYTYNFPSAWPSGVKLQQLETEIDSAAGIGPDATGVIRDYGAGAVYIDFGVTLTGPQQAALDAVVAAHVPAADPPDPGDTNPPIATWLLAIDGSIVYVNDAELVLTQ